MDIARYSRHFMMTVVHPFRSSAVSWVAGRYSVAMTDRRGDVEIRPAQQDLALSEPFSAHWAPIILVRSRGLEPPHPFGYMHLKHARLPIPPGPQNKTSLIKLALKTRTSSRFHVSC